MLMMLMGFWKLGSDVLADFWRLIADAHDADRFLEACQEGICS